MGTTEIILSRKIFENYRPRLVKGLQIEDNQMSPEYSSGDIILFSKLNGELPGLDDEYVIKKNGMLSCRYIQFVHENNAIVLSKGQQQPYNIEIDKLDKDFFFGKVIGCLQLRKNPTKIFESRL